MLVPKQMSVPSFGNFIKLIKLQCTGSWLSPRRREEPQIRNRPLRPALRSDICPGRRSRVSVLSGNTNPHKERVRISRDICDSRGRSSCSRLTTHATDLPGFEALSAASSPQRKAVVPGPEATNEPAKGVPIYTCNCLEMMAQRKARRAKFHCGITMKLRNRKLLPLILWSCIHIWIAKILAGLELMIICDKQVGRRG